MIPLGYKAGDAVIAVREDRAGFIDPQRPRLVAIDGKPIETWIEAASAEVPAASPQLVRERALRVLRASPRLRGQVGVPERAGMTLTLASLDGQDTAEVEVPVGDRKPVYGAWPRRESGWVAGASGRVGYVRLAEMRDGDALEALRRDLRKYSAGGALVLDLRGNGGGVRDPINVLADFLMSGEMGPLVYNAARPLVLPGEDAAKASERAASRFLFPAGSERWSDSERRAIEAFAAAFRPSVELPEARLAAWHYAVASKKDESAVYKGRLVVLMDERCFSAADVCLAALREIGRARERVGLPGITLMGQPSAGGSGLSRDARVAGGRIKLRLSSMISFRPDGVLFDGAGVEPDIVVAPAPTDFILGPKATDTVLERAVREARGPE